MPFKTTCNLNLKYLIPKGIGAQCWSPVGICPKQFHWLNTAIPYFNHTTNVGGSILLVRNRGPDPNITKNQLSKDLFL